MSPTVDQRRAQSHRPTAPQNRPTTRQAPPPQLKSPPNLKTRLILVALILVAGQIGVLARLAFLQVYQAKELKTLARQQQQNRLTAPMARYSITDRRNHLLAADRVTYSLFVHPYMFKQPPSRVAAQLAPIVDKQPAALEQLFKTARSGIRVADALSEQDHSKILALRLDGIDLDQTWERIYPQQELAADIVGYVDREHRGQAGLEYSQEKLLRIPLRPQFLSRDGEGLPLPELAPSNPTDLSRNLSLRLTLDNRLQRVTRVALQQQVQKYQALRGTTIVMDVRDGSLLALVSEPSFNPTEYYKANPALFRNWAVSDLYEPGSTFKPVNVAIALEHKAARADDAFYDEGKIFVGGWPIQNNDFSSAGGRGSLSLSQILGYSSNVGMVHLMQQLKPSVYYSTLERLGLGKLTGTDLAFETPAQLKPRDQFVNYPIEPATTAFGQGFSLTPIQMAQLLATLANGGKLVTPHVIQGMYDRSGKLVKPFKLAAPRQVFSEQTTRQVLDMMGYVVANGTGKPASISGYRLAGKTGTAQKATLGGYSSSRITSFIGLFPLESPRYLVFTVVDEPKGDDAYGSTVAVPVVKSVLESLITIEGIPPSHLEELKAATDSSDR
jgi:cell division protein FtsI (penicillin-binding protein 3)